MSARISALERLSRFPVGSSARISSGSRRSARAIETRCCSPPESSDGRCPTRGPRPTSSSSSRDARAHPVAGVPGDQRRQEHVLLRGQRRQQVEELKDEADPVAADPREAGVIEPVVALAAEADLTRGRRLERAEEVEHRALARARGAHDRDDLALADLERSAVERPDGSRALAVDLGQILRREHDGRRSALAARPASSSGWSPFRPRAISASPARPMPPRTAPVMSSRRGTSPHQRVLLTDQSVRACRARP